MTRGIAVRHRSIAQMNRCGSEELVGQTCRDGLD